MNQKIGATPLSEGKKRCWDKLAVARRSLILAALIMAGCDSSFDQSGQNPTPSPTISIKGETRMMRGTDPVSLLHPVERINAVYSFDAQGRRVDWVEGSDWQLTSIGIARSVGSRIPDFNSYTFIKRPDQQFDFNGTEQRNPPLTISYNVYIDYASPIADQKIHANPVRNSISKILCLGDSITAGAHTVQQFFFNNDSESYCGMLSKHLGIPVINKAISGIWLSSIMRDLDTYLAERPDVVILAFGMNDHTAGNAGLADYRQLVDQVIRYIKASGASAIVVGFFQQNELYVLENSLATVSYNESLREIALVNGVPFVDIKNAFNRASPTAEPFFHLTADFMHHPNIYGQRIYFSTLLPYFLHRETSASAVENFVILD